MKVYYNLMFTKSDNEQTNDAKKGASGQLSSLKSVLTLKADFNLEY